MGALSCLWITAPPTRAGYTTGMDDEPPLTAEEQTWLVELVHEVGPEGVDLLAGLFGDDT